MNSIHSKSLPPRTCLAAAWIAACAQGTTALAAHEAVVIGSWCDSSVSQSCDAAFRVDLASGHRTLVSAYDQKDFARDEAETAKNTLSELSRNRSATGWNGVAISPSGSVYVMAYQHRDTALWDSLYRIDPASGDRVLISPLTNPTFGPVLGNGGTLFTRLIATPGGRLLAHHRLAEADPIIAIDPDSGQRTLLSDPANAGQGHSFNYFLGLDPGGRLFAAEIANANTDALMELDPNTGNRSLLSEVPSQHPDPNPATAFACGSGSDIPEGGLKGTDQRLYCSDQFNSDDGRFSLDTVNTATGERSLLSDFGDPGQGPLVGSPRSQTWGPDGQVLVLDDGNTNTSGLGGILAIDTVTGNRTLLSDFNNPAQGPLIYNVKSFAVAPPAAAVTPQTPGASNKNGTSITVEGLSLLASADPVAANQAYTYAISFTNTSGADASQVKLNAVLPRKSLTGSVTPSQGKCKGKARIVCKLGSLAAGATATVNISLTVRKAGTAQNKVQVTFKAAAEGSAKKRLYKASSTVSTTVTP